MSSPAPASTTAPETGNGTSLGPATFMTFATLAVTYLAYRRYYCRNKLDALPSSISSTPRTVLVTGANAGIGYAIAQSCLAYGCNLILVCRTMENARESKDSLLKEYTSSSQSTRSIRSTPARVPSIECFACELGDFKSTQAATQAIIAAKLPIHVLINNAGVIQTKEEFTVDGFEKTFQVNYLSQVLFTHLLLDYLRKVSQTEHTEVRIINVGSRLEKNGHIRSKLQSLNNPSEVPKIHTPFECMREYATSKLASQLWTYSLHQHLQAQNESAENNGKLTVNVVTPGVVATAINRNHPYIYQLSWKIIGAFFLRSPAQGASTIVWLALEPSFADVSGKYFGEGKVIYSSKDSYDIDLASDLWKKTFKTLTRWLTPLNN